MTRQFSADSHTLHGRYARVTVALLAGVLTVLSIAGCGSKISEANYYRVHYGMDEEEVEDVLGPAHQESTLATPTPASSQPARPVKVKSWTRDGLTIHVRFEDGVVTGRSAEGPRGEAFKR